MCNRASTSGCRVVSTVRPPAPVTSNASAAAADQTSSMTSSTRLSGERLAQRGPSVDLGAETGLPDPAGGPARPGRPPDRGAHRARSSRRRRGRPAGPWDPGQGRRPGRSCPSRRCPGRRPQPRNRRRRRRRRAPGRADVSSSAGRAKWLIGSSGTPCSGPGRSDGTAASARGILAATAAPGRRPGREWRQAEEVRRPLGEIGQRGGQVVAVLGQRLLGGAQELQRGDRPARCATGTVGRRRAPPARGPTAGAVPRS